jgi:hypothetical protein
MGRGLASVRGRVLAGAGIGVLGWFVLPEDVAAAAAGGRGVRLRLVPAWLGVYFVLGCCLFSGLPYGQVLRELTAGLEGALARAGWRVPASTALTGLRPRRQAAQIRLQRQEHQQRTPITNHHQHRHHHPARHHHPHHPQPAQTNPKPTQQPPLSSWH